jgi:hypothetical protein
MPEAPVWPRYVYLTFVGARLSRNKPVLLTFALSLSFAIIVCDHKLDMEGR